MQGQIIFQDEKEIARLRVQNELLSEYEVPGFEKIFAAKEHLAVLDIGCNNGTKTAARFSSDAVDHVIGVEYNKEIADAAQAQYGDERFSFFLRTLSQMALKQCCAAEWRRRASTALILFICPLS